MFENWNRVLERNSRLANLLLFLVTVVVFAQTLGGLFVFDDIPQILENPFISNPRLWTRLFVGSVWSFRGPEEHANFYRPLQLVVYWLLCRVAGPTPAIFHIFQLLVYGVSVLLVYRLGRELLRNSAAAFVGALLWALHPLHVEPVAWISALPDLGAGFFCLWGFLRFLRAEKVEDRPLVGHGLAALAYFPALFFKETALMFPLLLLAYWSFHPPRRPWWRTGLRWLPYAGAAGLYSAIRIAALGRFSETPRFWEFSLHMQAVAVGLLGQHAKLFFWPIRLSLFRSFDLNSVCIRRGPG